jgi:hypothetical protein
VSFFTLIITELYLLRNHKTPSVSSSHRSSVTRWTDAIVFVWLGVAKNSPLKRQSSFHAAMAVRDGKHDSRVAVDGFRVTTKEEDLKDAKEAARELYMDARYRVKHGSRAVNDSRLSPNSPLIAWKRRWRQVRDDASIATTFNPDYGDRTVESLRHGVLLVFGAHCQHRSLAGQEHGRTSAARLAAIPAGESPANRDAMRRTKPA